MRSAPHRRLARAIEGLPLPLALVDLDAFDRNLDRLLAPVLANGKTLRVASKSVRVPKLLQRVLSRVGALGIMTYSAQETLQLAEDGFSDLLLAYPTVQNADVEALCQASRRARVSIVCDAVEQLDALAAAANRAGIVARVVVEVDLGFRPLGQRLHLGVWRSPLRVARQVVAFADRVAATPGLSVVGVMGYEAHIAGVGDESAAKRAMKSLARRDVERTRIEIGQAMRAAGHALQVFNGGGTGSVDASSRESVLTEITVGSGLLDAHLFDGYRGLPLTPAAFFALQAVRRPRAGIVTCHGGGYIASGAAGADRLPIVAYPEGAALLRLEGAGEVQTPVALPHGVDLTLGDPVFFRHAKAGELAEHFAQYHLISGPEVVDRAATYRGHGWCFLG